MNLLKIFDVLNSYWEKNGAIVVEPYDSELDVGLMHPSAFFRMVSAEQVRLCYLQPIRRPVDCRYGDNPYRLYRHYQYQVLLQPSPVASQQLYLDSLSALGFDLRHHDLRFVENDWNVKTIGAAGSGWKVLLDGLEISRFTYVQEMGGNSLISVPVEISYGVERIGMISQGVAHYKNLKWTDEDIYGNMHGYDEYLYSKYNFEEANSEALHNLFKIYIGEADRLLEANNYLVAYEFLLKAIHAYNVLLAISNLPLNERIGYENIAAELTNRCVSAYLKKSVDVNSVEEG